MLASDRREELKQGKLILQLKLEEELRNNRHISQKTQFLFEIEQKRASSRRRKRRVEARFREPAKAKLSIGKVSQCENGIDTNETRVIDEKASPVG